MYMYIVHCTYSELCCISINIFVFFLLFYLLISGMYYVITKTCTCHVNLVHCLDSILNILLKKKKNAGTLKILLLSLNVCCFSSSLVEWNRVFLIWLDFDLWVKMKLLILYRKKRKKVLRLRWLLDRIIPVYKAVSHVEKRKNIFEKRGK